jgi:hypothetical protein
MICTPFGTTVPSGSTSAFVLVFEQTNNAERVVAHTQPVLSAVQIHSQMAKLKAIRFGGPTVHSAVPKAQAAAVARCACMDGFSARHGYSMARIALCAAYGRASCHTCCAACSILRAASELRDRLWRGCVLCCDAP